MKKKAENVFFKKKTTVNDEIFASRSLDFNLGCEAATDVRNLIFF